MKFWDKFWKLVSKRHLVFGIVLFTLVIAISLVETSFKVKITFDDTSVTAATKRYTMNIPYDMVENIELAELPEQGEVISGTDDMTIRIGTWSNEVWGEHSICVNLASSNCIVVYLNDGRIFVFSSRSNEHTADTYETLLSYLDE